MVKKKWSQSAGVSFIASANNAFGVEWLSAYLIQIALILPRT